MNNNTIITTKPTSPAVNLPHTILGTNGTMPFSITLNFGPPKESTPIIEEVEEPNPLPVKTCPQCGGTDYARERHCPDFIDISFCVNCIKHTKNFSPSHSILANGLDILAHTHLSYTKGETLLEINNYHDIRTKRREDLIGIELEIVDLLHEKNDQLLERMGHQRRRQQLQQLQQLQDDKFKTSPMLKDKRPPPKNDLEFGSQKRVATSTEENPDEPIKSPTVGFRPVEKRSNISPPRQIAPVTVVTPTTTTKSRSPSPVCNEQGVFVEESQDNLDDFIFDEEPFTEGPPQPPSIQTQLQRSPFDIAELSSPTNTLPSPQPLGNNTSLSEHRATNEFPNMETLSDKAPIGTGKTTRLPSVERSPKGTSKPKTPKNPKRIAIKCAPPPKDGCDSFGNKIKGKQTTTKSPTYSDAMLERMGLATNLILKHFVKLDRGTELVIEDLRELVVPKHDHSNDVVNYAVLRMFKEGKIMMRQYDDDGARKYYSLPPQ